MCPDVYLHRKAGSGTLTHMEKECGNSEDTPLKNDRLSASPKMGRQGEEHGWRTNRHISGNI